MGRNPQPGVRVEPFAVPLNSELRFGHLDDERAQTWCTAHGRSLGLRRHDGCTESAARSSSSGVTPVQRGVDSILADHGGAELLARVHDHIHEFVQTRPACIVIETAGKSPQQTFDEVEAALAAHA